MEEVNKPWAATVSFSTMWFRNARDMPFAHVGHGQSGSIGVKSPAYLANPAQVLLSIREKINLMPYVD